MRIRFPVQFLLLTLIAMLMPTWAQSSGADGIRIIRGTIRVKRADGVLPGSDAVILAEAAGVGLQGNFTPDAQGNYEVRFGGPYWPMPLNPYCMILCFLPTPNPEAQRRGDFAFVKINDGTTTQDFLIEEQPTLPGSSQLRAFIASTWSSKHPPLYADSWPKNAFPGGWQVISTTDIPASIDHLYLPDDFLLTIVPNVNGVKVNVGTLEFGSGAIIDLSAPIYVPPQAKSGADYTVQPGYGEPGGNGTDGTQGTSGSSGTPLEMNVSTLVTKGSLWIRTDGQPGGKGGNGGRGGTGGGSLLDVAHHFDGGDGGNGGNGGRGGNGGSTSRAKISIVDPDLTIDHGNARATPVGPYGDFPEEGVGSTPPANFHLDDGSIFVFGAPGEGAPGGDKGLGGYGGDEGMTRSFPTKPDTHGGHHGNDGRPGAPGSDGTLGN